MITKEEQTIQKILKPVFKAAPDYNRSPRKKLMVVRQIADATMPAKRIPPVMIKGITKNDKSKPLTKGEASFIWFLVGLFFGATLGLL